MLAVTIFIMLPCAMYAQVDIHQKEHDGYTVVKTDPNASDNTVYTSAYQLEQLFEAEKRK